MGFSDIFLTIFCGPRTRERFFLGIVSTLWLALTILWILQPLLACSLWKALQVRSAFTQHPCMERMTQRALAFADRTRFFVLSNSTENKLLALIGKLLGSH